ncbi:MAG TPA: DUF4177 domain-containing protein [Acidobacteriaceae bacterium]|jgi:hypothetical protein|nr:DUF4177 domain-containing protein [Acidobacteriaceae bacterium]
MEWEYRVITFNTEYEVPGGGKITDSAESKQIIQDHLNEMGRDGWELVSFLPALPTPQKWKGNEFANPWMYHAVFKREIAEAEG